MITREDFVEKLSTWLSKETCEALAHEAEQRFAETEEMSVYELMLILIAGGDIGDFMNMCDDCGIDLWIEDEVDAMFEDMINEW